jgi:hypothetical protein
MKKRHSIYTIEFGAPVDAVRGGTLSHNRDDSLSPKPMTPRRKYFLSSVYTVQSFFFSSKVFKRIKHIFSFCFINFEKKKFLIYFANFVSKAL